MNLNTEAINGFQPGHADVSAADFNYNERRLGRDLTQEEDDERRQTWLLKAKELWTIKKTIRKWQNIEKNLAAELRDIFDNDAHEYRGVRYYYELRDGAIDYSAIPELKGVNLNKYRKDAVVVWKLEVTGL